MPERRRKTHIWEQDLHGYYPEPEWTSARLFEVETFGPKGALILDSCCGWGRILSNAIAAGYTAIGVDIVDRRHEPLSHNGFDFVRADFLSSPPPISAAHSAALNPPYAGNFIKKFVERTLPSSEEVFDDDVPF